MATALSDRSINDPVSKKALVIGNGEYACGNNLLNTLNDARDVTEALKRIGFQIDEPKLNLTCQEMQHALIDFEYSLKPEDLALFYFTGFGVQWEDQNFLIPTDNEGVAGVDICRRAINAQDILNRVNLRNPLATIFILDCCRVYHLRDQNLNRRHRAPTTDHALGLKSMSSENESIIVFPCAAGAISDDAVNDRNGLFTKHLLRHIESPNEHIYFMLADVMKGVKEESHSQQIPYIYSTLTNKKLCLNETLFNNS